MKKETEGRITLMGCITWRPLSRRLRAALALTLLLLALAPRLTPAASSATAAASTGGATMAFDRMFIDMMVPHH